MIKHIYENKNIITNGIEKNSYKRSYSISSGIYTSIRDKKFGKLNAKKTTTTTQRGVNST